MFDLYQGNKIDDDKKSMSFRMKFQSKDRTLTDEEVDKIMNTMGQEVNSSYRGLVIELYKDGTSAKKYYIK